MIAKASEAFLGVGFDIMGKHSFTELEVQIVTLLSNFAGNLADTFPLFFVAYSGVQI